MDREELLKNIKERLSRLYGERLRGIVLYGSEARGDAEPDSDIDFLVLLEGPITWEEELKRIIEALTPLQLEIIRPLSPMPVEIDVFNAAEFAVYRNVKAEGKMI